MHFDLQKQIDAIHKHGVAVWVSPHLTCSCLTESGQPALLCDGCGGTGRLYPPTLAYASTMLFQRDLPVHTLQETGFWTEGSVRATMLPGVVLGSQDYVRQLDVKNVFSNEVLIDGLDDTLTFRYGVEVEAVADRHRVYRAGGDYTVAGHTIVWTSGGMRPGLGEKYTSRYRAYPEYLVAPPSPGVRIEHGIAQSRVVILHLLEKLTELATLTSS
jgi:hypothetical protein